MLSCSTMAIDDLTGSSIPGVVFDYLKRE